MGFVYRSMKEMDKAAEIDKSLIELLTEMARENPKMIWLSGLDAMQQSIKWVESRSVRKH